jgi:protoporphyrinogen IX oxidase
MDLLIEYRLWIKTAHIVSITAWMAGLFYLPRLFVYHSQTQPGTDLHKTFLVMEDKLYRLIMQPAMIFSLTSGVVLGIINDTWRMPWLHLKLLSVILLLVFHFCLRWWFRDFAQGNFCRSERFYRIVNELPALLLIVIVACAVIKPF